MIFLAVPRPAVPDIRIGLVCRRWRAILLDTSYFWADMLSDIVVTTTPARIQCFLALRQRSSPRAIHVALRGLLYPDSWNLLYPCKSRLSGLIIDVESCKALLVLHRIAGDGHLPSLTRLQVNWTPGIGHYPCIVYFKRWDDACVPKLAYLDIPAVYFTATAVKSLTTLMLTGAAIPTVLRTALKKCVSLEHLTLSGLVFSPRSIRPNDFVFDAVNLPKLREVTLRGGHPPSIMLLLPNLRASRLIQYNIDADVDGTGRFFFGDLFNAAAPRQSLLGFQGEPDLLIDLVNIGSRNPSGGESVLNVRASVFEDCCLRQDVFSGTIHADSNNPDRLATSLLALMRLFPETTEALCVDAIPCPILATQLSKQDLWEEIFDVCGCIAHLELDGNMNMAMKRSLAAAFLAHASRNLAPITAEDSTRQWKAEIHLMWTIKKWQRWDRRTPLSLETYAEELGALADVLSACAFPDSLNLTVDLDNFHIFEDVRFFATRKEDEDTDARPNSDENHEREILTHISRLLEISSDTVRISLPSVDELKRKWEGRVCWSSTVLGGVEAI